MDDFTKDIVKSSLNFITPNISKLVFEDIKVRKVNFKKPSDSLENSDDETQEFHKSTKSLVAESLTEVREREIDKTYNEERHKSDKPDSSGLSTSSAINEPYFKNSKRKNAYTYRSNTSKKATVVNNTNKSLALLNKQQAVTNKILKTQLKASIEMQRQSSSAILESMAEIKAFQQETTLAFYNDTSEKLANISRSLNSIGKIYSQDLTDSYMTDKERFNAEIQANGIMFNMLGKIFKENLSDGHILDGVLGEQRKFQEEIKDIGKKILSPKEKADEETGEVKKGFFDKVGDFAGRTVKKVRGLDDLVGSMPYNMQYMLNSMKGGTKLKGKIFGTEIDFGKLMGNAFGRDLSVKKDLSANRYEKGPVAYNGLANRAITNVIPSLLSKILSTLNGKEELIYDYDKGEFADKSAVRAERDRRLQNTVKENLSGDISRILGENASEADIKKLETVFHNMAMEGKTISDYKGPLTDDKELDSKIQEYYSKTENKGSLNRNLYKTSIDMKQFYTDFARDLAGQMANDYGNDIYSRDRKEDAKYNAKALAEEEESRSGMSFEGKLFNWIGGLSSKLSGKLSGEPSSLGSELEKTVKEVFGSETSPSASALTSPKSVLSTSPAESRNADIIAFLQSRANSDSINVFIKGGILDSIRDVLRTKEEETIDINAGFKSNQSKMLLEEQEDAQDRAELMTTSDKLASEQESRIASFEQRRDNLLTEMETKMKNGINSVLERTGIKDKFNQVKMGLGKRFASSKLGKTSIGKIIGKTFSSPQQVENAGMTPVYVMGSAVATSGIADKLNDTGLDLDMSKAKDLFFSGQGKVGGLLSSVGGKLAGKKGILGKAGSLLGGAGDKLSSTAIASRAKNAQNAMDSGLGTELKKKVAKDVGGVGKVTELAESGTTTGDAIKSTAKSIGSKALDVTKKTASVASKATGKIASKAGEALTSVATKNTGSKLSSVAGGAGKLLSGGGSALTSMGDKLNPEAEADKKIADMKVANAAKREALKDKMEMAREKLKDMWANKNEIMRSGIEKAQTMAREAKKTVMELGGTAKREKMKDIGEKIMGGVRKVWDTVREGAKTGIEVAGSGIKAALTAISGVPGLGTALAIAGGIAGTALLGVAAMALVKKLSQPSDKPQGGVPSIDIGKLIGGGKEAKQAEKTAKKQSKDALKAQKENKSPFGEFAFTPDGDTSNGEGQDINSGGNGIMTNPLGSLMNLIATKKKISNSIKPMSSNVKSSTEKEKEDEDSTAESTKRLSVLQVKLKGNYFYIFIPSLQSNLYRDNFLTAVERLKA